MIFTDPYRYPGREQDLKREEEELAKQRKKQEEDEEKYLKEMQKK